MIALEILDYFRSEQIANGCTPFLLEMYNEAIAELEALQSKIDTVIEEIEYAIIKPQYAEVYLNNAIRFLKDNK